MSNAKQIEITLEVGTGLYVMACEEMGGKCMFNFLSTALRFARVFGFDPVFAAGAADQKMEVCSRCDSRGIKIGGFWPVDSDASEEMEAAQPVRYLHSTALSKQFAGY